MPLVANRLLGHMHLRAARELMGVVSFSGIVRDLGTGGDADEAWYDSVEFWAQQLERSNMHGMTPEQVLADARNFRELEALVKALDSLETMASYAEVAKEYDEPSQHANTATNQGSMPPGQRDFWNQVGDTAKASQENMQPLLKGWLLSGTQGAWAAETKITACHTTNKCIGGDQELKELRQAYLPETVLAYISALHFSGTGLSRDWLLECMNLASLVAERGSDLEETFVEAKRVKELLEALAASSKALAIVTGEKRAAGTGSKKMRERGWSRDLWSVNS